MQTYNVSRLPSMIKIGWDGENLWRPQAFDCSVLLANHPNGVITIWLLPNGETDAFPVALERDGNMAVWTPTSAELVVKMGQLQLMCVDGVAVGKSAVVYYQRSDSLVPGEASDTPSWAVQVVQDVNTAASHYPKIENGYWWVWDVTNGIWVNTMVKASGADIDPAEIADAVEDYMDEHPVEITVDDALSGTSENPVQNKIIKAALDGKGTYSKPSGGIPATDLAQAVQTSLEKADDSIQNPSGGTDGQVLTKTASGEAWQDAPTELPSGGSTGDFLRKTASGAAWQTVPAAESNSFGGGS